MVFFNKENFVSARFVNERKTDIEVLYKNDLEEITAVFVQADADQEEFVTLLNIISVDEIQSATNEWLVQQHKAILNFHKVMFDNEMKRLEIDGVVKTNLSEVIFNFNAKDKEHKDSLTALKLEALDIEGLSQAKRKKIRDSKTIVDLVKCL